ncbi:cell division protein FtsL [Lichenicola sp.]|uniref:cell division protein FtsL n=1 Tax=Lichenicola sp. TaxID=2804529 RepID=UPI003AFFE4C4
MIRPFTCVCALLAGASGLYLYSEKHRTTLLDQQISKVVADTQATRERTAMLRAEWELLNQPDRLGALAGRFLPQLTAMAPTQFVQLASLDQRLPPPGPETPPHPIVTPQTAPDLVGQTPAAPHAAPATPDPDGMAIAQADTARTDTRQLGRKPTPQHATQLADAAGASDVVAQAALHRVAAHAAPHASSTRPDGRTEVARLDASRADAVRRAWSARLAGAHQTAAVHYAAYTQHPAVPQSAPMVTAVSSYARPPTISATAWRPASQSGGYNAPASYGGSALGSGQGHLAAPVPLSDGN